MVELPRPAGGREKGESVTLENEPGREKQNLGILQAALHGPLGRRRDDQTSCAPQSGVSGGQLMTGYAVFPDITGPRPLLLPATATNTVGTPSPEETHRPESHIFRLETNRLISEK